MAPPLDLTSFDALSFDCYGTLIDWEAGMSAVLGPWAKRMGADLTDEQLLAAYADHEAAVEAELPGARYPEVLAESFRRTGAGLGLGVSDEDASALGSSVGDWPAFPDSADALARLQRHYRLIILSNVHRDGFEASNRRLGVTFDTVLTAEDIGSYKPDQRNFDALQRAVGDDRLLHVAQSLFHDHVPAHARGLPSVWINRRHGKAGWGATPAADIRVDAEFPSMAAFVDAVDAAFSPA